MTYNFDWLLDHPYWTFNSAVGTATDEFPSEWRRFWGIKVKVCPEHLDPDEWEAAKEMHEVAQRLCHAAGGLQGTKLPEHLRTLPSVLATEAESERRSRKELAEEIEASLSPDQEKSQEIRAVLQFLRWSEGEAGTKEVLFRTAVEIYSYPDYGLAPGDVASRLLDLLDFLVRTRGERTREYLRRVAMCYVRDMRPEMAVMSRAVLEAALHTDEIEQRAQDNLRVQGKPKPKFSPGLKDLIQAASDLGVFDEHGRAAADLVKNAGDDAIHNAPQQAPASRPVLENLRLALQQVERFKKEG